MSITLNFPTQEKLGAKTLPLNAVDGKSQSKVSLIREGGKKVKVKLGDIYGDWVEIRSGLEIGEKIMVPVFQSQQKPTRQSPLLKKD
jgi:multidrug efflux pump subunit AcrA (membrane-fusion protein)